ncbi:MAG: hypothetical protein A2X25_06810 [Chloroflexi bacterium GWB2_49_20]|nr:MAG: hypothetical protein A2X25_06810 [Chloroflexi bacterium GWB2_49_20]OGN80250.1 MAG: hypothetical protein A2X26_07965 [Chloroflexi bacterium GWC2_49_37]OGN86109.1 MAG: hypothetical protein A2X27_00775 [Chloroflexi bacterium GWD2_49_16]HCC79414.1 hypothetical protein [Anaerolineae bacterium]HCM96365.1 hypothetical protein [Anaerolineae bacterium]
MDSQFPKSQVDRLGQRLKGGDITENDIRILDEYRRSFGPAYELIVDSIRQTLGLTLTGRPAKSTSSIIEKLHRETIRLSQIQDIAGCRIITSDINIQNKVITDLVGLFPEVRVIDRRNIPSHGYRAVHVVPIINGRPIEIQVRTFLQHKWAELSEKLADIIDPAIKYGVGPEIPITLLDNMTNLFSKMEKLELVFESKDINDPKLSAVNPELTSIKADLIKLVDEFITKTREK